MRCDEILHKDSGLVFAFSITRYPFSPMNNNALSYADAALSGRKRRWLWLLPLIALPLAGFYFIGSYFDDKKFVRVSGESMLPTLRDGDRMICSKDVSRLKRGDIVIFSFPKDTSRSYLSRIIGLPGEELEIRQGKVFINSQPLNEPYIDAQFTSRETLAGIRIIDRNYFVMGDHRNNSYDSCNWGLLPSRLIFGKFIRTY